VVADAVLTTHEDQEGSVTVTATDANGDNIGAVVTTAPQKGRVSVSGVNTFTFTYAPDANVHGSDAFAFRVTDGRGGEAQATVSVNIVPQPDDPVFGASHFAIEEDEDLYGDLQAEDVDGDSITYSVTVPPNLGTVTMDPSNGAFTYRPAANVHGNDQFQTQASSGGVAVTATTTIAIASVNDAPVTAEDQAMVVSAGPFAVPVLANDFDVDGDALSVSIVSATPGVATSVVGGTIEVTPLPGMSGPTSLDYRVTDPAGAAATATLQIVVDRAQNFFYLAATGPGGALEIWRHDRFLARRALAPIPDGHTLLSFTTSQDGGMLAFTTLKTGVAGRHWLWVKDQYEITEPLKQVNTPTNYLTGRLSLNSTGDLLVFDDRVVDTHDPSAPQFIESGVTVENPVFEPHTTLYYTAVLPGGGRAIRREKVAADGTPFDRTQVTGNYNVGEGLGIDFRQTPNYARIVSTGLLMPPPSVGNSIKQNAFVTWWDGSGGDMKLHPDFTHATDIALQPWVTADSTKTVYYAILGGVSGLYSTDLFNPGFAVRMLALAPNEAEVLLHGDSSTVFVKGPLYWSRATIGMAGSVPFTPSPSTPTVVPRRLATAPDGHAVVFDVGAGVYAALGGQFDVGTPLYTRADGGLPPMLFYAPDGTSVVVVEPGSTGSVLVNPRAGAWSRPLDPAPAVFSSPVSTCIAFAGQGC
jgi:hypothetical protein